MLPVLSVKFESSPIERPLKPSVYDVEFSEKLHKEYLEAVEPYTNDTKKDEKTFREALNVGIRAANPGSGIPIKVKAVLRRAPFVTNAFVKLYEILHLKPLKEMIVRAKSMHWAFIADLPGTFNLATKHFIAMHNPALLNKYTYVATSLPPDAGPASLGDDYGLYAADPDRWILMDHTSYEDTEKMRTKIPDGSVDFVTGDIGKPLIKWDREEHELFLEDFGQLLAALLVLKEGGNAVLKMFNSNYAPTISLLRLTTGLFRNVIVHKPLASRWTNNEVYWVLIDYNRDAFKPLLESIMAYFKQVIGIRKKDFEAIPPSMFPKEDLSAEFLERVYVLGHSKNVRMVEIAKLGGELGRKALFLPRDRAFKIINGITYDKSMSTAEKWLEMYPIRALPISH